MNRSFQRGPQGVRGDRFSGSKVTNLASFQPYYSATEKIYTKYFERFKNRTSPWVQIETIHDDFVFPVTKDDIISVIENLPTKFITGIKAILVPSGSKKQIKALKRLLVYGEYWQECVFLHPYPKILMNQIFDKKPNPQLIQEYQRTGAHIKTKGTRIEIRFDEASLKKYYLYDILMHEIGHHNDQFFGAKPRKSRESFADWFAMEYGYNFSR
jgi:hypothetical protein